MEIAKQISELIENELTNNGYILDEVLYVKEGGVQFLRIVIDKEGFINVDDCLKVCHIINPILDTKDPIKEQYMLDVCSKEKGRE
ncbi:MAG: hypothetical protein RR500_05670 [Bacilli bacterium]